MSFPTRAKRSLRPAIGLASVVCACLATPVNAAAPSFTEVTALAGITHVHSNPLDTTARVMHGGGTVGDFNRDGCPDLFLAGGGLAIDSLYINQCDGTFVDEAVSWGLTDLYRGNGANAADFDGDGWMDLYVTNLGDLPGPPANGQHKLYRNLGNGTFSNVAAAAGVETSDSTPNGFGVTWGDYDLDGDLDLFVGGWRPEGQAESEGSRLFQNDGDGTFTDVTVSAGVFDDALRGFGAIFADMDGDRYPELLIAGDFGTSRYFINDRDGTFTRRNFVPLGEPIVYNGMGTSIGDVDRDGRFDWWVTSAYPAPRDSTGLGQPDVHQRGRPRRSPAYRRVPASGMAASGGEVRSSMSITTAGSTS